MDWSTAENVKCADCTFGVSYGRIYQGLLVCNNPAVLARTGGPRSCRDIVRAPGGPCKPDGALFKARVRHADVDPPQKPPAPAIPVKAA